MNRHRNIGALSFPALLLAWTIGAALIVGCFQRADAVDGELRREQLEPSPKVETPARVRKTEHRGTARLSRYKALARQDLQGGRFADAYYRLRPSVADAHGDTEYLGLLALAAMRMGSYGEAMVIYQRLTRIEPGRRGWYLGLALAREQLGLDATSVYREALMLSDGESEVRTLLRAKLADTTAKVG
jgi:cytochrome c-type biogenesis protein CcmH/NrfG